MKSWSSANDRDTSDTEPRTAGLCDRRRAGRNQRSDETLLTGQARRRPGRKYFAYTVRRHLPGYQRARLYLLKRESAKGANSRPLDRESEADLDPPTGRLSIRYDDQGTTGCGNGLTGRVINLFDDLGVEAGRAPTPAAISSQGRHARYSAKDVPTRRSWAYYGASRGAEDSTRSLLEQRELGQGRGDLEYDAGRRARVQSWLMRPPGYDPSTKYPLVLEIHAGRSRITGAFGAELHSTRPRATTSVLNPRGSTSYAIIRHLIHHAIRAIRRSHGGRGCRDRAWRCR